MKYVGACGVKAADEVVSREIKGIIGWKNAHHEAALRQRGMRQ